MYVSVGKKLFAQLLGPVKIEQNYSMYIPMIYGRETMIKKSIDGVTGIGRLATQGDVEFVRFIARRGDVRESPGPK